MFVVNTTSATVGAAPPSKLPRNRVPSSSRRNPGVVRCAVTGPYGFFVAGALVFGAFVFGAFVFGAACVPFVGAALPPAGPGVGAGCSGTAGLAVAGGALTRAGAFGKAWSSTDFGARPRDEASDSRNARPRKIPPHHQLAFVSRLPVWRVPRNELAELLTPPNDAAMPPPCPACISTAATRTKLSRTRRTRRKEYSI